MKGKINVSPTKSIFRWFLICFLSFSLLFFIALIPLISYCRGVFTDLEIRKSTQQMDFGVSQIENTITGVVSASQSLTNDIRFLPFLYLEPDYTAISVSVRNQIKDYLNGLLLPLSLVSDSALQFSQDVVITPSRTIFNEQPGYYPYFFHIEDMDYEEWITMLKENGSGFLPVQRVVTNVKSYDALIYSIPWTTSSYLYVCMDIAAIKQALIEKSDLSDYCLTIEDINGQCLYTDLSTSSDNYYSVTQKISLGGLRLTIHIPETALTSRMEPLYYFLALYLALCSLILMVAIFISTRISSKPLLRIISMLEFPANENGTTTYIPKNTASKGKNRTSPLHFGFHYIQDQMQTYQNTLADYQNMINMQTKILQARFLEKAFSGALATDKDYDTFYFYFPTFPKDYCLVRLGLIEQPNRKGNLYEDALSLIQIYIQSYLPHTYYQQLTDSEVLLIIDKDDFEKSSLVINRLIENVNLHEPSYHVWGITSKFYHHPKNLPTAYWQLQDLYSRVSIESLTSLCSVSDYHTSNASVFHMADATGLHTAIIHGNEEIALMKLSSYSNSLKACNQSIFEMIRSILLCIKQEYSGLLLDVEIPTRHTSPDMYISLKQTICTFCDEFKKESTPSETSSFSQELKTYIDAHYTDDDLCYTTLAEHFQCSPSKIRSAFSELSDISVSAYIENKRMMLANELLTNQNVSVSEVAQKCGYANNSTFYKAFRRKFGYAPSSIKAD